MESSGSNYMIITNKIARWIVGAAEKITPGTDAVTVWPFIFIKKEYANDQKLLRHERKHLEQWKRYWIVGFFPIYLYQFLRFGYKDMALEVEAREAEK